jgi:hypothetical protein
LSRSDPVHLTLISSYIACCAWNCGTKFSSTLCSKTTFHIVSCLYLNVQFNLLIKLIFTLQTSQIDCINCVPGFCDAEIRYPSSVSGYLQPGPSNDGMPLNMGFLSSVEGRQLPQRCLLETMTLIIIQ